MNNITHKNEDFFLNDWLEGKISDSQLKEKVPPDDFLIYLKLKKSIGLIEEFEAPLEDTLQKIKANRNKIKLTKKPKVISLKIKWVISIAASILLFFGITNFFNSKDIHIQSSFGEQKEIVLLDGSQVILNAKSSIKYNKKSWENKRELFLDGEAYFKVKKGSTFTVKTDNGSVTVIGTQFNIYSAKNYFDVICYEGKVKVINNNKTFILEQGEAIKSNSGIQNQWSLTENAPNWISGQSSFKNDPLKIVIDELEKQFKVVFERQNIDESINYTGSFNNKKLKLALASVFKPMNIIYTINGNTIILNKTNGK